MEQSKYDSYEIRLSWDNVNGQGQQDIDLDLQCVILDDLAQIEDAVYYNQQSSNLADVKLSDDKRGAQEDGQDEVLKIKFQNINFGIKYLAILVCSHNGHPLNKVETAHLEVKSNSKTIISVSIGGQGDFISYLPCIFSKQYNGTWDLTQTDEADKKGKTFLECEDLIKRGLIKCGFDERLLMEAKNWNGKKSFNLQKEDILLIPDTIANSEVFVGLGWDTRCDIDSSILTFDEEGNMIENIYFGHLQNLNHSIIHKGDNLTGDGDGDDEVITIKLHQLDQRVKTVWSVITIYTIGKSFKDVSGAFCRLVDCNTKKEFCKYNLSNEAKNDSVSNGCIMACIKRYKNNLWAIQPKGYFINGQRVSSGVAPIIKNVLASNLSQVKMINDSNLLEKKQSLLSSQSTSKNIQSQLSFSNFKQLKCIKAVNLISLSSPNSYAIIKVNKKRVGQTEKSQVLNNPNWAQSFQLQLKEGDILKIKVYNYVKMYFDNFMGKVQIRITKDMLESNIPEIKLKVLDKKLIENTKFTGNIEFKLEQ